MTCVVDHVVDRVDICIRTLECCPGSIVCTYFSACYGIKWQRLRESDDLEVAVALVVEFA